MQTFVILICDVLSSPRWFCWFSAKHTGNKRFEINVVSAAPRSSVNPEEERVPALLTERTAQPLKLRYILLNYVITLQGFVPPPFTLAWVGEQPTEPAASRVTCQTPIPSDHDMIVRGKVWSLPQKHLLLPLTNYGKYIWEGCLFRNIDMRQTVSEYHFCGIELDGMPPRFPSLQIAIICNNVFQWRPSGLTLLCNPAKDFWARPGIFRSSAKPNSVKLKFGP